MILNNNESQIRRLGYTTDGLKKLELQLVGFGGKVLRLAPDRFPEDVHPVTWAGEKPLVTCIPGMLAVESSVLANVLYHPARNFLLRPGSGWYRVDGEKIKSLSAIYKFVWSELDPRYFYAGVTVQIESILFHHGIEYAGQRVADECAWATRKAEKMGMFLDAKGIRDARNVFLEEYNGHVSVAPDPT